MKLGMCIDVVEIWFGMLMGNLCQFLTELSVGDTSIFLFQDNNLGKSQWIFTKLDICIYILWRSGLGFLVGKVVNF